MVSERYSEEYDHLYAVGLNPCCGGRWSQSSWIDCDQAQTNYDVLILVVVEDGLRAVDIITTMEECNMS